MAGLFDVLYMYAAENLVVKFHRESTAEKCMAQREVEKLTDQLNSMDPGAEERVEKLKMLWDTLDDYHDRAVFLSGLSIGMELGRL